MSDQRFFKNIADGSLMGLITFELPEFKCTYINSMAAEMLEVEPNDPHEFSIQSLMAENVKPPFRPLTTELLELEGVIEDIMFKKK